MDLRHFECFNAVANCLHFARAAEQLGISPPALTKQIQALERDLGTRLFNRSKRTVALTSAGALFAAEADLALRQFERARQTARRAARGEIGAIKLGFVASATYAGVLQREVSLFREHHADVEIEMHEVAMVSLPQMLEDGRLDLAFLRPPMSYPAGIDEISLISERFVLATSTRSSFAHLAEVHPRQLANESFVVPEQESGTQEVGRRGGYTPIIAARPGSLVAVVSLVSLGRGVAIVPSTLIDRVKMPGVVYCEVAGKPIPTQIAMAFRRHERAPAVCRFIEQLKLKALPAAPAPAQRKRA
jgi:DNA-binding transcriptional LysR family regulator